MENLNLTSAFALLLFVLVLRILFSDCVRNAAKKVARFFTEPNFRLTKFFIGFYAVMAIMLIGAVGYRYASNALARMKTTTSHVAKTEAGEDYNHQQTMATPTAESTPTPSWEVIPTEEPEEKATKDETKHLANATVTSRQPVKTQSWVFTTSDYIDPVTGEETEVQTWELVTAPEAQYDVESYFNDDTWQLRSYALWAIDVDYLFSVKGDDGNIEKYCVVLSANGASVWLNIADETVTYGEYGDNGYSREYTVKLSTDEFYGDSNIYTIDEVGTTASGDLIRLFDEICNFALYVGHSDCPIQSYAPQSMSTPSPTKDPGQSSMRQGAAPVGGAQQSSTPSQSISDPTDTTSQGHQDPVEIAPSTTPADANKIS
jgi:hypothetical protein